jgi:Mn2+/Fe2+ NRAMP family transporter
MLIGLGLNFVGIDPIKALIYSAVGNGIVAPVILILILLIARSEKIMGEWKNSRISSTFAWILTFLMTVSGVAVIYTLFVN